ncbi:Met-10+ like-protein-domain-containing protein [Xylariaceae sp. FL0016]|nr:Met-10+ like-protein-domain-containing protein [Xylariaceae sp. FL0016]
MEQHPEPEEAMTLPFRPPTARHALGVLDRALFSKTVRLAAASIADRKQIAPWRARLAKEGTLLHADRINSVVPHPPLPSGPDADAAAAAAGTKCLLLDLKIQPGVPDTYTTLLRDGLARRELLGIVPYDLRLDYDYWLFDDVLRVLLPPDLREVQDGIPGGFNQAGHVAHMNLKEQFWPYKQLIAQVVLDKNPSVKTVINKVASVGTESEFRTFAYEVLAGPDDLDVSARENDCSFHFDYSKVYWNSKLEGEHSRLIKLFQPGEVVCDVMAGIGPFAVPAGKKGVFVWANDYNPESYKYLDENIKSNKAGQFVRPFNEDGRAFIRNAADSVYNASVNGEHALVELKRTEKRKYHPLASAGKKETPSPMPEPKRVLIPPTISHFVMNLPASAITFLPYYKGLYTGHEELFTPHSGRKLPMIHVHCFAAKGEGNGPLLDVCERIATEVGVAMSLGDVENPGEVSVLEVRNVAPNKRMFCASFRLPAEVAFASRN